MRRSKTVTFSVGFADIRKLKRLAELENAMSTSEMVRRLIDRSWNQLPEGKRDEI